MTRLHYSNRTEALLAQLAADLARHRADRGPWEPAFILVPNRNVQLWLQQGLADALGIAANLRFLFLDQLWQAALPVSDPPLRLLDRPVIQGQLLALLAEPAFRVESGFGEYLEGDGDGRRAVQLSGRLARLFEEYLLSRPDWMVQWEAGRAVSEDPREGPQRRLWKALRARLQGAAQRWLTLPEWVASPLLGQGRFPDRLFVFGLSQMAHAYHEGFRRLGPLRPLDLYVLNPCEELWEDVQTPAEAERLRRHLGGVEDPDTEFGIDPYGLLEGDQWALQRWGRPGRENLRLLNLLVECDFEDHFEDPPEGTLLARLQSDLLHRRPTVLEVPPLPVDDSLRIVAAASPRREAEAVASAIWELVRRDRVRFSDLAVLVPPSQKAEYLDHLRAAFEACHRIPWVAGDEAGQRLAEWVDGAKALLQLPRSAFTRAELLGLLDHPAIQARFPGLEGDWAELCAELGVVRGLDAHDAGGERPGDLWTWAMGARRLALGSLAPPGELDCDGFIGDPVRPPEQGAPFLALVSSLLNDARRLRDLRQTPAEWAADLARMVGGYLGDAEGDAGLLARIQRALQGLETLEVEGLAAPRLGYPAILELALGLLEGLKTEAAHLGQGVMVATHAPMRALPFQGLFLMGLGEGVFPGPEVRNALDLREGHRRAGDVSRPEQDRYLFLENLLCARRQVHFSFVRRDASDGAALEPSPLLRDLEDWITALTGAAGWQTLVQRPPVDRHDAQSFQAEARPEFSPAAFSEAQAAAQGPALRHWVQGLARAQEVRRMLTARGLQLPELGPGGLPERLRISFPQLRKWLCCPLQGGTAVRLGLRGPLGDEDETQVSEEPLATGRLDRQAWLQQAFFDSLGGLSVAAALERGWRARMLWAQAPIGVFAEAETTAARAIVEGWRSLGVGEPLRVVRFGEPGQDGLPAEDQAPFRWAFEVEGRSLRLDLEGATPPFNGESFLLLSERQPPRPGKPPERGDLRDLLKAWIACAALRSRDLPAPAEIRVLSVHGGQAVAWSLPLPSWTPAVASARLRSWCEDLVQGDPGPLPIEALAEQAVELDSWIAQELDQQNPSFSSLWGPLPDAARLPVAADWAQRAERRLGEFLRALRFQEEP